MVLFHEGDAGGSLHVLMTGRASIWVTTPSGDTVTLNVIGPGTAFGELSLLLPATERTATVQAIEPVQTLMLSRAEFERLRRNHPSVDRLLVDGRLTLAKWRRKRIYARMNRLISEDQPYIFLYYPKVIQGVRDRVGGLSKPGPAGIFLDIEKVYIKKE